MVSTSSFHGMSARSLQGQPVAFEDYRGKVVLVVNTASHCGFTPQYAGLESLYRKFGPEGFVVLGFPCNQFGNQEPGDEQTIAEVCERNFGVTFPMFEKCDVKGPNALPLFQWLTAELPGFVGRDIRWNFTKFLLDREGKPVKRYAPTTPPEKLESKVRTVLASATGSR